MVNNTESTVGNASGLYRNDADVAIDTCSEGGYALANLGDSEWVTYTVYIPTTGNYGIRIRYAAANDSGQIKFAFGGVDKTTEVTVPFGAPYSTGLTDWENFIVIPSVALTAGVQSMRVYVGGASQSFRLNYLDVLTASALPVSLISFTAQANTNKTVSIKWATSIEVNSSHFVLNHSNDGVSFTSITTVPSLGSSGTYQFIDNKPYDGTNFYELVQVDNDGKETDFGVREVALQNDLDKLVMYPNPLKGTQLNIKLSGVENGTAVIKIVDISGRMLQVFTKKNVQNGQVVTMNLNGVLPSGNYIIRVNDNQEIVLASVE